MDITVKFIGHQQVFRTKVAGVTHLNEDGTDRQAILKALRIGEHLVLKREPSNPYDKNAVAVFRANGQQVGYIPAGDARLANHIDSGGTTSARVLAINGGPGLLGLVFKALRKSYGCVIEVVKVDPDWKQVTPYMDKSREIEQLISKTQSIEAADPMQAIANYRLAIQQIADLDHAGEIAASWRRAHYPINRLSLLLEKQGDHHGALEAIRAYEDYDDIYGISSVDKKTIASRKERLTKHIAGSKKE
jgi:HIRAN domain